MKAFPGHHALAAAALLLLLGAPALVGGRNGTVQVTTDRFRGHVEPDVAINPRNRLNLLGACQYETGPRQRLPGTFASFDGGRSWRDDDVLPLPQGYEQGADTTVAFTRDGTGYVAALMSHGGSGYASRVERGGVFLWKTLDGGRTFSNPIAVYIGPGFQDHPWLAIRNTPDGPVLYLAWTNRAGLEFTRSRPGTTHFARPHLVVPGSAPSTPVLVTGAGAELELFFQEVRFPTRGGKLQPLPTTLAEIASHDGGRTFDPVRTIAHVLITAGSGGRQPPPLLAAAADPVSGASSVAIAAQNPQRGHPVIELWQRAKPGGRWRGPNVPVAGAAGLQTQEQPRLVYANGQLSIFYFTISRNGTIRARLTRASRVPTTFTPQALPGRSFRADGFIGDYQALAIAGRVGYALWNSSLSGRLEIVASRFAVPR